MSESASWELQKAIKTLFTGDASLATLLGGTVRFYDLVPEDAALPYIEFGEAGITAWDTDVADSRSGFGEEHLLSIHVWSSYEGKKEASLIQRRVRELLQDNTSLSLGGHTLVNMRFLFSDLVRDPDGQAFHAISQFRAVTEEN